MARHDSDIVLGDAGAASIYLELPSLIQRLDDLLAELQAKLERQDGKRDELLQARNNLDSQLSVVEQELSNATRNNATMHQEMQTHQANLMPYNLTGNFPLAANQWRLFDLVDQPFNNLFETTLFDAQDKVGLSQDPVRRQMTTTETLDYAQELLNKDDSERFHSFQFTQAVVQSMEQESQEALRSNYNLHHIDEVLQSRQQLYNDIGNGSSIHIPLNAHKYKNIYSDIKRLRKAAKQHITHVQYFWKEQRRLYDLHVPATESIATLTPKMTALQEEIRTKEASKNDLVNAIASKNADIEELDKELTSDRTLFHSKMNELNDLKNQFKTFNVMLGDIIVKESDASTSTANSSETE